jgi:flagella basal body P-ring formation protein FlgA
MMMALPLLFALSTLPPGCRTIQAEMILARDVAAAIPAFAQVPADLRLGYLPGSGAPRILLGGDLQRIAKNQGAELSGLPDVCFSRQTFIPQPEDIRVAIRTTLADVPGIAAARIEVTSSSQHPVPFGKLIFPRSGLQFPSGTQPEAMWRGLVHYAEGDFPVWARVRILANRTRVVALANIPTGKVILKNQVRLESCEDSLLDETTARNLDDVIGFIPKNFLRASLPIRKTQLAAPPDIAKGDIVDVQVNSGAAHLVFQGKAQSEGVKGSTILIRNLSSGKDFRARVVGKNQAVVGDLMQ